ncbi:nucleoside triphosphate pyrophosphohydrolase [Kushneria phosphatilytica]|uniref:Nucleoside triphosphate pyrophosphohydrolase n=1 Tax=Kushneria phosphatilytica TaxID=657387 RepID=A0A1S1NYA5_9GAMM|nr:nucleoside triphosphate pyrophosphohydrolase [Kushneria phosphatilytica]OHV11833.1 nucleoside triphosphate pyrophosphohydrolase [Kushneria phosphatilytica]QEL11002.1 nucleoside triphosphate pyrophosphohydrolase [Kushneria phosphatilytica]
MNERQTSDSSDRRYDLSDLLKLMAVLRDPQYGCPWDVRQNWESIVPHTLEEAHEVADAIERRAFDELPGELGDLLFQVVYYARFGEEEGRFDFHDIVHVLTAKMIARHPHVFPEGTLESRRVDVTAEEVATRQVHARWESRKAEERAERAAHSVLDDVPSALPALARAGKLSRRVARVGFDWPDHYGALAKVREELGELQAEIESGGQQRCQEELGDLLFAVSNLARHLDIDPEQALRGTNRRFEQRFRHVEDHFRTAGQSLTSASLEEMESCWQNAKRHEQH